MKDTLYIISGTTYAAAAIVLIAAFLLTNIAEMWQGMLWGSGLTLLFMAGVTLFAAVLKEGFGPQA